MEHSQLELAKLPQAIDEENALLGTLLLNTDSYDDIANVVSPNDFFKVENRIIFGEICKALEANEAVNHFSIAKKLNCASINVDGLIYLNSLETHISSSKRMLQYADAIRNESIKRHLIATANDIIFNANNSSEMSADDILEDAEKRILSVADNKASSATDSISLKCLMPAFLDELDKKLTGKYVEVGVVRSGFASLDSMTNGFKQGNLIIVGGRPSMGKTSFAMNIAEHAMLEQKLPVLVFSLEMTPEELSKRFVGSIARVDQSKFNQTDLLTEKDMSRIFDASAVIESADLEINNHSVQNIGQIRGVARRMQRKHKKNLGLIIIDYIQLMEGEGSNRTLELAGVTRGLKKLAQEMNCPVIALSQLNRLLEQRDNKRPMMSDLRDSGAIEQDADMVLLIYRDEFYTQDKCKEPGVAEIIIGKQRNGSTGTVKLAWDGACTRFSNLEIN